MHLHHLYFTDWGVVLTFDVKTSLWLLDWYTQWQFVQIAALSSIFKSTVSLLSLSS